MLHTREDGKGGDNPAIGKMDAHATEGAVGHDAAHAEGKLHVLGQDRAVVLGVLPQLLHNVVAFVKVVVPGGGNGRFVGWFTSKG
jgi:hypothetical protein